MTNQKPQAYPIQEEAMARAAAIGIPDICAAVDSRSKAVLAAEEFAACKCRLEMLKGQVLAEQDRLTELCRQVNDAMDEAIKEAGR